MWVYAAAKNAGVFDRIAVATDDKRIADAVERHGGIAVMTSSGHRRGTDRIFEALQTMPCGYVVNLQGDEPQNPTLPFKGFRRKNARARRKYLAYRRLSWYNE